MPRNSNTKLIKKGSRRTQQSKTIRAIRRSEAGFLAAVKN